MSYTYLPTRQMRAVLRPYQNLGLILPDWIISYRHITLTTVEWETLVVENFGESTKQAVGEKYFGEWTQYTKTMANQTNRYVPVEI